MEPVDAPAVVLEPVDAPGPVALDPDDALGPDDALDPDVLGPDEALGPDDAAGPEAVAELADSAGPDDAAGPAAVPASLPAGAAPDAWDADSEAGAVVGVTFSCVPPLGGAAVSAVVESCEPPGTSLRAGGVGDESDTDPVDVADSDGELEPSDPGRSGGGVDGVVSEVSERFCGAVCSGVPPASDAGRSWVPAVVVGAPA